MLCRVCAMRFFDHRLLQSTYLVDYTLAGMHMLLADGTNEPVNTDQRSPLQSQNASSAYLQANADSDSDSDGFKEHEVLPNGQIVYNIAPLAKSKKRPRMATTVTDGDASSSDSELDDVDTIVDGHEHVQTHDGAINGSDKQTTRDKVSHDRKVEARSDLHLANTENLTDNDNSNIKKPSARKRTRTSEGVTDTVVEQHDNLPMQNGHENLGGQVDVDMHVNSTPNTKQKRPAAKQLAKVKGNKRRKSASAAP